MLPIKEGMQNINAIILLWISKNKNKQTLSVDSIEKIANVLNITERLLLRHFEIKAVIVPAHAETSAIADNTAEAELISK